MIVNILKVCGVGNLVSYYHMQDIAAAIVMGLVIVVLSLTVFLCGISCKEKYILFILGFLATKIRYEDIIEIKQDAAGKFLLIYYKAKGKGSVRDEKSGIAADVVNVNCNSRYFDEITKKIKEKNPDVIIEFVASKQKERDK